MRFLLLLAPVLLAGLAAGLLHEVRAPAFRRTAPDEAPRRTGERDLAGARLRQEAVLRRVAVARPGEALPAGGDADWAAIRIAPAAPPPHLDGRTLLETLAGVVFVRVSSEDDLHALRQERFEEFAPEGEPLAVVLDHLRAHGFEAELDYPVLRISRAPSHEGP